LSEYTKLAKVKPADVEKWLLPVAAARLRERVPGEEQWLLDMIDEKLRALKEKGVSATPFRKPSRLLRK
jgi:hypothetical protein